LETERVLETAVNPKDVQDLEKFRHDLQDQSDFIAEESLQYEQRLQQCEALFARLKGLSAEYQIKICHNHNPAANDPALRIRLTGRYNVEAETSKAAPKPYQDSDGNYVFKTPIDNIKMANTAYEDVNPAVANDPAVIQARLLF
jgi:hypothetical protein